ncbi:Lrp/AsnC family transcriptional regulator [Variovorax sp. J2P1-59]|uniref:Lrp/AsnC family transcriptional regulator n=1 Tax=Variovorax flavidus TaxID=3053501 RepID=UPI0025750557|nr:Lrp/AsnC family transcriptional regulator [Variovorax sp. J2P1-59]MDM0076626.1 Lrp/AsnC family transcriptional regulator [Variovorax sp. J2P1-59]
MQIELDHIDRQLMAALQQNARLTTGELAQMTGLSQSPCWRRIRRLEESGLIDGYHARLSRRGLGYGVVAFVSISIDHQNELRSTAFVDAVRAIPEVLMFHGITGTADFLLMVVARDLDAYSELLQSKLHRLPGVKQVQTSFSLQEFKRFDDLPIPAAGA